MENTAKIFSTEPENYAVYRPQYPSELFEKLSALCQEKELAWDAATGSGQAAHGLSSFFKKVLATDMSSEQISQGLPASNIEFRQEMAETSSLSNGSADLVFVSQALHWLDLDAFYQEANRVLKKDGVFAAVYYPMIWTEKPNIDRSIAKAFQNELSSYIPTEVMNLDEGYKNFRFPFEEIILETNPHLVEFTFEQYWGYLHTLSTVMRYQKYNGKSPFQQLEQVFRTAFGSSKLKLKMQLFIRVGKKKPMLRITKPSEIVPKKPILTKNDHYRFGYNSGFALWRGGKNDQFHYSYGSCQRLAMDWKAECLIAAKEIFQSTKKPISICLSGGIDSEVVAEAFRLAQIPFRGAILRFKNDLNIHDISWAIAYCESKQIPYDLIELDLEHFFKGGEAMSIASSVHCTIPFLTPHMKLIRILNENGRFPVVGSGECNIRKVNGTWGLIEAENLTGTHRYQLVNNLDGVMRFFKWSPELIVSFLKAPQIQSLVQNKNSMLTQSSQIKSAFYKDVWGCPERPKYRGYEKVPQIHQHYWNDLHQVFPDHDQEYFIQLTEILKLLNPK